jgi:segregation and condensation protein B
MNIETQIESILFLSPAPLSPRGIAQRLHASVEDVQAALAHLSQVYNGGARGIRIATIGDQYQMTTAPEHAELVAAFVEDDLGGDLTEAQLETITIIAYRGPIARTDLERIRGVNCSVILRHLTTRGLIARAADTVHAEPVYAVTLDFLKTLGIAAVGELPDYATLHASEAIDRLLAPPVATATAPAATML